MGFSRQEYWSGVPLPSPEKWPILKRQERMIIRRNFQEREFGGLPVRPLPGPPLLSPLSLRRFPCLSSVSSRACQTAPCLWGEQGADSPLRDK